MLTLQAPRNWPVAAFFVVLAILHLGITYAAFRRGMVDGGVALGFACSFGLIAITAFLVRRELTILPRDRQLFVRTGWRRFGVERHVDFSEVHAVRLTLGRSRTAEQRSKIEILCANEDILCPATKIPRQEALFLAILFGVELIKVTMADDPASEQGDRIV